MCTPLIIDIFPFRAKDSLNFNNAYNSRNYARHNTLSQQAPKTVLTLVLYIFIKKIKKISLILP